MFRRVAQLEILHQELDIDEPATAIFDIPLAIGWMLLGDASTHIGNIGTQLLWVAGPRQYAAQSALDLGYEAGLAKNDAGTCQRHMFPSPGVDALIAQKAFQARCDGAGITRGPQAHIDFEK